MRIGLFTDTYHPVVNGISFVIDITRQQLEAEGHEVFIFAPKPEITYKESDDHVFRYPAVKGILWDDDMTSVFFPPREVKRIRELDLDVIHFFTPDQIGLLGAYAALKNDIPLVAQHSTDIYEYLQYYWNFSGYLKVLLALPIGSPIVLKSLTKNWRKILPMIEKDNNAIWKKRITAQFFNALYEKCDAVVALSPRTLKQMQAWDGDFDITVMPTGVDKLPSSDKDKQELADELGIKSTDKIVLYAGRLVSEKNLELLVEAFGYVAEICPDAKLVLAGQGEHKEVLDSLAEDLIEKDRYVFAGSIPRNKLGSLYEMASLFAFPSNTDTQGLVLNEAANAGLPLVVIDPDVNSIIQPDKNALVTTNNPTKFSYACCKILKDDKLADSMSQASKKIAAKYSAENQTKQLLELYEKISR